MDRKRSGRVPDFRQGLPGALALFLAVADERSFTRAAKRLGISPSAVSHSMRDMEESLGVRLLSRTTRSVALTEAGEQLRGRLQPAFSEIQSALGELSGLRRQPAGRVRLLAPRLAVGTVLTPKVGAFIRKYPDIVLDITTDDSRMDIVARGFDAGIQFGEYIARDMIAVRVSPDIQPAIVCSPNYLKMHGRPKSPRDLASHRCINFRHGDAGLYRWEFEKGKKSMSVAVGGPLIVDDLDLVLQAAIEDAGLAYMDEARAATHLDRGSLVRVLEDWCQPFPGYFLFYPSRRQQAPAVSALIGFLRL